MDSTSKVAPELFIAALGLSVQRRRSELGLSQDDVAQRSGLHRTYISELERHSRNFSIRSFLRISYALEMEPSDLIRAAEQMANAEAADATKSNQ
jgi:transcriptional regulator with XRE-family HTH domain